jgi:hypothetical protein
MEPEISVTELIDHFDAYQSPVELRCKLIGTFDGHFSLICQDATELNEKYRIPVHIDGLLELLRQVGLSPGGGSRFAFGGRAMIRGYFSVNPDSPCPICMNDFDYIEVLQGWAQTKIVLKKNA